MLERALDHSVVAFIHAQLLVNSCAAAFDFPTYSWNPQNSPLAAAIHALAVMLR